MHQSLGPRQTATLKLSHQHPSSPSPYIREALKAFRKFVHDGKVFYTCNVERLKQCDRLGSAKEISLWRTHFFLYSRHFTGTVGVVFSQRPGNELASLSKQSGFWILLKMEEPQAAVCGTNGVRVEFDKPLEFASAEAIKAQYQTAAIL